jgi:hypothetical protein
MGSFPLLVADQPRCRRLAEAARAAAARAAATGCLGAFDGRAFESMPAALKKRASRVRHGSVDPRADHFEKRWGSKRSCSLDHPSRQGVGEPANDELERSAQRADGLHASSLFNSAPLQKERFSRLSGVLSIRRRAGIHNFGRAVPNDLRALSDRNLTRGNELGSAHPRPIASTRKPPFVPFVNLDHVSMAALSAQGCRR